jgi:coproporphyrinogen III oxidase
MDETETVLLPSTTGVLMEAYCKDFQTRTCATLEEIDGSLRFSKDRWDREGGGGGLTRIGGEGAVIEKGGVNTSAVHGLLPEGPARRLGLAPALFFATGVSLVIHPRSPLVPTIHLNLRYIELGSGEAWFGGGVDLTPFYPYEEDIRHFHRVLKDACEKFGQGSYARYKAWCDRYFFIRHRNETRGVGGIFFDRLRGNAETNFGFVKEVGESFLPAYVPIIEKHVGEEWGELERSWQLVRRGRYVEFNLMYDQGTLFGLETNGRVESILMSLPPLARWDYDVRPEPGSREARLIEILTHPRDWA